MGKRRLSDTQVDRAIDLAIQELGFKHFQSGLCAPAAMGIWAVLLEEKADLVEATDVAAAHRGSRRGHVAVRRKSTLFDYRGKITFDQIYEFVHDYPAGFRVESPVDPDLVRNLWCAPSGKEWQAVAYATMFVARAVIRGSLSLEHPKFRGAQVLLGRSTCRKPKFDDGPAPDVDGAAAWLVRMLEPHHLRL